MRTKLIVLILFLIFQVGEMKRDLSPSHQQDPSPSKKSKQEDSTSISHRYPIIRDPGYYDDKIEDEFFTVRQNAIAKMSQHLQGIIKRRKKVQEIRKEFPYSFSNGNHLINQSRIHKTKKKQSKVQFEIAKQFSQKHERVMKNVKQIDPNKPVYTKYHAIGQIFQDNAMKNKKISKDAKAEFKKARAETIDDRKYVEKNYEPERDIERAESEENREILRKPMREFMEKHSHYFNIRGTPQN